MIALTLSLLLAASGPDAPGTTPGVGLSDTMEKRSARLVNADLTAFWSPSGAPVVDEFRFSALGTPAPLDEGGGLSSDTRQILALILGFVPGFGLGHLVARDRDGFILFLIIDIALYALWGIVSWAVWGPFWGVGGLIWLVVHIIQGLDAYGSAGGERIVQLTRERSLAIASAADPVSVTPGGTSVFRWDF